MPFSVTRGEVGGHQVKNSATRADNQSVRFDVAHPTPRQVRDGLISGIIAESVAIPILLTMVFTDQSAIRWGYIVGAIACLLVSLVYLALFVVVTNGKAGIEAQANVGFVMVCLALSALGFIELGSSNKFGTYLPAILVGVTLVSIIGDRRMRVSMGIYAMALVAIISWAEGLRGSEFAAVVVVYASTITVIVWIISRAVGSLTGHLNVHQSLDVLNEVIEDVAPANAATSSDVIRDVFRRGLPVVAELLPADQVVVFTRNGTLGRFVPLVTWPDNQEDVSDLAELPELTRALRTDSVVLNESHCAIPVGYCVDGELVMILRRTEFERGVDDRAEEAADLLASTFLRVTSRANFVSGLQAESRTDPLTGLANRRNLYERIEVEMAHALRSETPLSIAMIDLDHFKQYNDQFGHVAGDTVLRSIAAVMVSNIRGQDLVARFGGEEFCLVMPDTDLVGGHHLLDKLRAGGREATSEFGVTLSAGLTSWDGIEDTTSFIERADQALYRAKESGRNRVVSIQAFTES